MTTPFRDRACVLTGASSGIGFATAVRLLEGGATVHVVDMPDAEPDFRKGDQEKGEVYYYGGVDVSSRAQVTETFSRIRERSPRLSGLVNCAGVFGGSPLATNGEADDAARRIMDVNFWGAWNCGTEFLKGVLARGTDDEDAEVTGKKRKRRKNERMVCVVNVASMAALRGMAGAAAYVASKHAVLGLTRSWAQEFGGRGVRVNAVAPGVIRPLAEEGRERGGERGEGGGEGMGPFVAAVNRAGEADDVAGAILFLLGGDSGYVSGQVIEVNGGWA